MKKSTTFGIALCVILLAAGSHCFAADPVATQGGGFFSGLENIGAAMQNRLSYGVAESMSRTGFSIAESLRAPALTIGGALALAYLMYRLVQSFGPDGDPISLIFKEVAIPAMIAAALINDYGARMADFQQVLMVLDGINPNPLPAIVTYFTKALSMAGAAISTSYTNVYNVMSLAGVLQATFWMAVLDVIATMALVIPVILIILFGLAEVAGIVLLGPFLFAVGIAFGPIFLALMVVPWTQDYLGKWLGFIVAAKMVSAVAGVVVLIASQIFSQMFVQLDGTPVAASLALVAIMLLAINSILGQIPSIASALVPGTLGSSGGGMTRTLRTAAKGNVSAARSTMAGARSAAGSARSGASWARDKAAQFKASRNP